MIYLKNKDLMNHYNQSLKEGTPSKELLDDWFLIANNVYKTFAPDNSDDKLACVNYAVGECYIKWGKYNPERTPSIFAFFTSMVSNDIKQHYKILNRHNSRTISISKFTDKKDS